MNKTYTVKQVADMLGYSTNSIYTFLKKGKIKGVRIGKGRFHIFQEELEKLLYLKKSQNINFSPVVSRVSNLEQPIIQAPEILLEKETPSLNRRIEEKNIPCLFDWFISLVSIIIGFTMFVFVRNFEESSNIGLSQFLMPIKINLFVAGTALFFANVINQARKKWHFIFYSIIFLNLSVFSLVLFLNKDLLGFVIFALLSFIIFFHTILDLKGIISFALYVSILTILLPILIIIYPSSFIANFPGSSFVSTWSPVQTLIVWLTISGAINSAIWLLKNKYRFFFWTNLLIFSIGLIYFAYLYAAQLYWSRALIFILIFLSVIISSFWHRLNLKDEKIRKTVASIFGDLTLMFLAIVMVINISQNNIRNYAKDELFTKLVYGRDFVESNLNSTKEKLETLSKNKQLIEAVKKNNQTVLDELTKGFFVYSADFRRVLVADEKGDLLSIYPDTDVGYKNISFRDYFKNVKANQKSYLSNLFQAQADGVKRSVISINMPIIDENGNFIGIIIGSLDIDSMAKKLQQIANVKDDEHFILIDENNNLIIKPNNIDKLSDRDVKELVIQDTSNIHPEEIQNFENRFLQVRDKVDNTKWTIAIRRSLIQTYDFDGSTSLLLSIIIVIIGLLVIFWNVVHLKERT